MSALLKLFSLGRRRTTAVRARAVADSRPPRPANPADGDDRSTLPTDSWATSSMDLRDGMQIVELEHPPTDDGPRPH